jgi:membrane-associated phospholipid phosphatase
MWVMFIVWKFFPTAPPWMYDNLEQYAKSGTTPPPLHLMHREGCAFSRLDRLTGIPFFFNMFGGNPVPFASFPSGHVAWPMCIYVTAAPGGRFFTIYVLWVGWATLYSCHHYLSDAIVAVIMVIIIYKVINYISEKLQRTKPLFSLPAIVCSLNIV